jgi:hypothetical protein
MSISASAVLVDLNISVWTARKLDKKVSEEINVAKNTTTNAGNYSKNLLAGSTTLSEIQKFAAGIRNWHATQTLPWSDNGTRMLPMANFMDYKAGLNTRIQQLEQMFNKFFTEYPTLVGDAANKLGSLFNVSEYPDVEDVKTKFKCKYVFSPMPEAGDFRVNTENQLKEELMQQYEQEKNEKVNEAMRDAWNRLHEALLHISERMEDADDGKGGKVRKQFRSTVLDNPYELCGLLSKLNITKDPQLEEARKSLERTVSGVSVDDLRESESMRQDVKQKVDAILKKFDW